MKKLNLTLISLLITLSSIGTSHAYKTPKIIKILKSEGVVVRESIDKNSKIVDTVYEGYIYDVTDVHPSYYQIKLEDGSIGWIYANRSKQWTKEDNDGNKVTINLPSGITARYKAYDKNSEIVGIAKANQEYEIKNVAFSHYQITTPREKIGWIYAGTSASPWVHVMED